LPDWIEIKAVKNKQLQQAYLEKVDNGEASAIALAMELTSPLLILDDLKGRKLASQLNLKYTGTLGVLILAKQVKLIPSIKYYFDQIKHTDFRIAPELLERIIEELGE
jgi:predicted nucleic acid-binding protein